MSERPSLVPGTAADHTVCLLVKLGQVAFRICEDSMSDLGLRVRHYSMLQALADNGPTPQLALGSLLRIDPATMVSGLDDLEREGLAERARDPRDRRRYVVQITPRGTVTLAHVNGRLEELDDVVLADLPAAERRALHGALTRLASGPEVSAMFDAVREQATPHKTSASRTGPAERG